MTKQINVATH